jgi:hypothetical protein
MAHKKEVQSHGTHTRTEGSPDKAASKGSCEGGQDPKGKRAFSRKEGGAHQEASRCSCEGRRYEARAPVESFWSVGVPSGTAPALTPIVYVTSAT